MRFDLVVLSCALFAACNRPTEVRGIYVTQDNSGMFFPCEDPNSVLIVPDSNLAAQYHHLVGSPNLAAYVHLRGISTRSGSIYSGRRYFVVQRILEIRPRAPGECPNVAPPASAVLP